MPRCYRVGAVVALILLALAASRPTDRLWMDACIFTAIVSAGCGVLSYDALKARRKALHTLFAILVVGTFGACLRMYFLHATIPAIAATRVYSETPTTIQHPPH